MKLYDIDKAILDCIDEETGEVIDEEKLNELQMERDDKLEGVACWIKELDAQANAIKQEKQSLNERQKAAERRSESLRRWLAMALGGQKFTTAKAAVSFRKSQTLEIVDETDIIENHAEFLKFAPPTIDKTALKKAIKDGEHVRGAVIEEHINTIIK